MPIYEYACSNCGTVFEKLHLSAAQTDAEPTCPECGKGRGRRILSRVSTIQSATASPGSSCGPSGSGFS